MKMSVRFRLGKETPSFSYRRHGVIKNRSWEGENNQILTAYQFEFTGTAGAKSPERVTKQPV